MSARVVLALTLVACGTAESDDWTTESAVTEPAIEPRLSEIQRQVFDKGCASSTCHSARGKAGDLVLAARESHAALVAREPANDAARAKGMKLVVPGDPERSFLWKKITDVGPNEGQTMPKGLPPLERRKLDAIRAWIEAGARDD